MNSSFLASTGRGISVRYPYKDKEIVFNQRAGGGIEVQCLKNSRVMPGVAKVVGISLGYLVDLPQQEVKKFLDAVKISRVVQRSENEEIIIGVGLDESKISCTDSSNSLSTVYSWPIDKMLRTYEMAFSQNGSNIFIRGLQRSDDSPTHNLLQVWDIHAQRKIFEGSGVSCFSFNSDRSKLMVGNESSGNVYLCDPDNGSSLSGTPYELQRNEKPSQVGFSSEGNYGFILANNNKIYFVKIERSSSLSYLIQFNLDGGDFDRMLCTTDGRLILKSTNRAVFSVDNAVDQIAGRTFNVSTLCDEYSLSNIYHSNSSIAMLSSKSVKVYSLGKELTPKINFPTDKIFRDVAFSPDGKITAILSVEGFSGCKIDVLDDAARLAASKKIRTAYNLAISEDKQFLAACLENESGEGVSIEVFSLCSTDDMYVNSLIEKIRVLPSRINNIIATTRADQVNFRTGLTGYAMVKREINLFLNFCKTVLEEVPEKKERSKLYAAMLKNVIKYDCPVLKYLVLYNLGVDKSLDHGVLGEESQQEVEMFIKSLWALRDLM